VTSGFLPAPAYADTDDLPVRVRQANLAPQLRDSSTTPAADQPETSPESARNTVAAMQRGWERGRAVPAEETESFPEATEPGPETSGSLHHREGEQR